ncbi:hypothetical protein B4168_0129 [Anoxybacillus flavithermus]|nr:hypothetical protein B4168_0129 [Anoxybacillus flavithermus]
MRKFAKNALLPGKKVSRKNPDRDHWLCFAFSFCFSIFTYIHEEK